MTRDELFQLAAKCCHETAVKNEQSIKEEVSEAFCANQEDSKLSLNDAIARSTALALSVAPRLAAATTVRILIELGLVQPDDEAAE